MPDTLVGFENHGGRTLLAAGARPLATVELGHGNNDRDSTEGALLLPNEGGLRGLRIGTYLHGPLLPRNPHIADALIAAALGRGTGTMDLAPLDDRIEWAAHDAAVARLRRRASRDRRIPGWAHRAFDPIGGSSATDGGHLGEWRAGRDDVDPIRDEEEARLRGRRRPSCRIARRSGWCAGRRRCTRFRKSSLRAIVPSARGIARLGWSRRPGPLRGPYRQSTRPFGETRRIAPGLL